MGSNQAGAMEVIGMPPKYQKIADELRLHIQSGKYMNARTLPTEFAIAEEYQVSRQTVRQAAEKSAHPAWPATALAASAFFSS